jgi:four helix bundle protein
MRDFHKLDVWLKSHAVTLDVYRVTTEFPKHEVYGLVSQLRRSAASVSANIAEGCGRHSDRDFARFLDLSLGSASETEYHLLLAKDLDYLPVASFTNLDGRVAEVKRMLTGLLRRIRPPQQRSDDDPRDSPQPPSELTAES